MQRRLTIALVGVALATVLFVGAGVLILAQLGARTQATEEASEQLDFVIRDVAVADGGGDGGTRLAGRRGDRARRSLGVQAIDVVRIESDGVVASGGARAPAAGIEAARLDAEQQEQLLAGETIVIDETGRQVTVLALLPGPRGGGGEAGAPLVAIALTKQVDPISGEARVWFLLSALAVLGGALAAGWWLARRISRPVTAIEQATAAIASGDFTTRVDVEGDDELAMLGRSVNRMAVDLERSRTLDQQFLMSVSHDLRTPLTAISGYAEALRDGAVDDTVHAAEVIGNHAQRLERLVGDLLDLAKLDANRFRLDRRPIDAAVAVGRSVAGLQPQAAEHGIELRFVAEEAAPIETDPDRLAQMVGNLVENAINVAASSIIVTVATGRSPDGGQPAEVVITVADDGPGIHPDDLPHVFERLYTSRTRPTRSENPSGMGLAIVRELATAMAGSITVDETTERGTRMRLRLPVAPAGSVGR